MLGYMPSPADPSWNDGAKWAFCRRHRWGSSGATDPIASPFWLPKDVTVSQDGHTKRRKRSTPNTWDLWAYDSQAQRYSRMDLQTMRSQRTPARYLCSPRAV